MWCSVEYARVVNVAWRYLLLAMYSLSGIIHRNLRTYLHVMHQQVVRKLYPRCLNLTLRELLVPSWKLLLQITLCRVGGTVTLLIQTLAITCSVYFL